MRSTGPTLIVEDDAVLADDVPELLRNLEHQSGLDHVTLEARGRAKLLGRHRIPVARKIALRRLYLDWAGAAAYVLWPAGAEKLLVRAGAGGATVDWLISTAFDLKSYQTDPACAVQLDMLNHYKLAKGIETVSRTGQGDTGERAGVLHAARKHVANFRRLVRRARYLGVARAEAVTVRREVFGL